MSHHRFSILSGKVRIKEGWFYQVGLGVNLSIINDSVVEKRNAVGQQPD